LEHNTVGEFTSANLIQPAKHKIHAIDTGLEAAPSYVSLKIVHHFQGHPMIVKYAVGQSVKCGVLGLVGGAPRRADRVEEAAAVAIVELADQTGLDLCSHPAKHGRVRRIAHNIGNGGHVAVRAIGNGIKNCGE